LAKARFLTIFSASWQSTSAAAGKPNAAFRKPKRAFSKSSFVANDGAEDRDGAKSRASRANDTAAPKWNFRATKSNAAERRNAEKNGEFDELDEHQNDAKIRQFGFPARPHDRHHAVARNFEPKRRLSK